MNKTLHRHKTTNAFTLIELLVVIAIIAILASILFPVFAAGPENARRASCQSNEKQLGLGFLQYVQDYDEKYPCGLYGAAMDGAGWAGQIYAYTKSAQIYVCPSDSTPLSSQLGWTRVSYAYNSNIPVPWGDWSHLNAAASSLSAPAKTVLLCETAYSGTSLPNGSTSTTELASGDLSATTPGLPDSSVNPYYTSIADRANVGGFYATGYMGGRGGNPVPLPIVDATQTIQNGGGASKGGEFIYGTGRHLDGSNFLLADGHVKWLRGDAVSTGYVAVNATDAQGTGQSNASPASAPNKPGAEGTGYSGANAHAITFSPN